MAHWYTFARFASTIVNGRYAIASHMNKQTSIYGHFNIIARAICQPSPHKLQVQVTFLLRSTRSSLMMPSEPCLLLQLLTHLNTLWSLCCVHNMSQVSDIQFASDILIANVRAIHCRLTQMLMDLQSQYAAGLRPWLRSVSSCLTLRGQWLSWWFCYMTMSWHSEKRWAIPIWSTSFWFELSFE